MANTDYPFLVVKHVTKTYTRDGAVYNALDDVSLTIKQGEIFSLLGVNGAGKTTLSSILATVHPPTSGDVIFNGMSIYQHLFMYRRHIGLCPQYQNLDMELTVRDNLVFAGRYFLLPAELIARKTDLLLEQFELERYAQHPIMALSGGTKQRVLIARALMHDPKIIILDEPTVGLDPDIRRKLWLYIKQLKAMGITVILTTHYLDEAEELSDRVCILNKGKVVLIESMQALRERHNMARLEDIFLRITQSESDHG